MRASRVHRAPRATLEALMTASPDAMLVIDSARRITFFNEGAEQMFALSQADVLGKQIDTLLPDRLPDHQWRSRLPRFLSGRDRRHTASARLAIYGRRRDSELFAVDASVARSAASGDRSFILVMRDAAPARYTDRPRAITDEHFKFGLGDAIVAFAITDPAGRFRAVNGVLCDMLGYTERELLSRTFMDITRPDDLPADLALANQLLAGQIDRYRLEQRFIHKLGHVVWSMLSVSLVRDASGAPAYFVAQATDVTELKNAQQVLSRHAAELERSNHDLEHFAHLATHDLQEPLRTMSSYVQQMLERYRGRLDERGERWLRYIGDGADRMKRQIGGLLALARVRTDGGAFAPTDTTMIVDDVWSELRMHPGAEAASLWRGPLPTLCADGRQLEQLFRNLLSNSIRYSRTDTALRMRVTATLVTESDGPAWQFTVEDNGSGVEMTYATRIFEMFERVPRADQPEGSGLGLSICERIVRRHGGRIWLDSTPGQGARFSFTIREPPQ
jgi:PAS domain S-box-containing protein